LQFGSPTPIPTPDIPTVRFLFPENGSSVIQGTDLTIEIVGEDSRDGVARIELLVNDLLHQEGRPLQAIAVPVFTVQLNWLAEIPGFHSFTAIAYRADGTASAPVTIQINVLARE